MIAETRIYPLGKFTIRQQPLFDNPAFAHFLIYLRGVLVGKQLSVPNLSDAEWHLVSKGVYATVSRWSETSAKHRIPGRGRSRAAREFLEALEP